MPRRPGSTSQLSLRKAVQRFPPERPTLLVSLPSKLSVTEGIADMKTLRRAAIKRAADFLGEVAVLAVVTRGIAHLLMTNGYLAEEPFFVQGHRGEPKEWYLRHHDDITSELEVFLIQEWPRVSGLTEPFLIDADRSGFEAHHGPYLCSLPLFKDTERQRNWRWWIEPGRSRFSVQGG